MKQAILLIIGDEILSGNVQDSNSCFIASAMKGIGIEVKEIIALADEASSITRGLEYALANADVVISTGGLGPTKDDKTKKIVASFFGDELVSDPETLAHLKNYLIKRNRAELFEINRSQADIPSKCKVLQNHNGTAPCMMMEEQGRLLFVLPGVPYEVKPLVSDQIVPFLAGKWDLPYIMTKIISVVDFPESQLSEHIASWEDALPSNVSLAYLPTGNRVRLKLTAKGSDKKALEVQLSKLSEDLKPLVKGKILSWNGDNIAEILAEVLKERKLSIATAESCTGGTIAKMITSVSGSSAYFIGGIVPYDYHQKIKILGVSEESIRLHTVVSEAVAQEMSKGCQNMFDTDIAVATTGVAGPNKDEFNNDVGIVYYSIRIKDKEKTYKLHLPHLVREDFVNFVSQRVIQDLVVMLSLS